MAMPSVSTAFAGGREFFAPCFERNRLEFQGVTGLRSGRTMVTRTCPDEIALILKAAQMAIGTAMAPEAVVRRVAAHHPDALWSFSRNERLVGCLAMLMLNEPGLEALLSDNMDFRDPASDFLADPAATPAGIYIWGILAPPLAVDGVAEVMLRLRSPKYDSVNIYAFQTTERGARLQRRLGFAPVIGHPRKLFQYVRLANRPH
jgi:hypothetical protein